MTLLFLVIMEELDYDCLSCIAAKSGPISRLMFALSCKQIRAAKKKYPASFRAPHNQVANIALIMGNLEIFEILKGLGMKIGDKNVKWVRGGHDGVSAIEWVLEHANITDKSRSMIGYNIITKQSSKEVDFFGVSMIIKEGQLSIRTALLIYEKWEYIGNLEKKLTNQPHLVCSIVGQTNSKRVFEFIREKFNVGSTGYEAIATSSLRLGHYELFDSAYSLVDKENRQSLIDTLTEKSFAWFRIFMLEYLISLKLLPSRNILEKSIYNYKCPVSVIRQKQSRKFFVQLVSMGTKIPADLFSRSTSERGWNSCSSYLLLKTMVKGGAHPDQSGKIIGNFSDKPHKIEWLRKLGFR